MLGLNLLLIGAGVVVQCLAVGPTQKIIAGLPDSSTKRFWHVLQAMIFLFILGYVGYGVISLNPETPPVLIVSSIFFAGAWFVLLVCYLALQTVNDDVKRVAELEHENITDPLTGLYNRRHLDEQLPLEFTRCARYDLGLSLIMLDIDHFKKVNDTYGHDTGDDVLREIGALLKSNAREIDLVARYGGEEMTIVLPHTDEVAAAVTAERFREAIEHFSIETGEHTLSVTASLGLACCDKHIDDAEMLMQCADKALYEAKRSGRNRVVLASQLGDSES